MAELHQALTYLSPTYWDDIAKDNLSGYLTSEFNAGELLVNSVPPPPNGTPFESSQPQSNTPNFAKSAKEIHSSSARPTPPHKDHADLQKNWGKPMKFSQKENPLNVALYKMAGHDRHGAWYARHNIVEGIGFSKFKKALMREFPETLLTQGVPGAGAKRGLSAERRVDRIEVDGVGRVEVYQLSAQMPHPVSPRDFLTLFLTTDQGLTDKSATDLEAGNKYVPRHYMIVSRPLDHPDAPQRSSYVRGQYESVEMIREIPLHTTTAKSKSTSDLLSVGDNAGAGRARGTTTSSDPKGQSASTEHLSIPQQNDDQHDPELNPVEWIMVTRSDPAGGIPRFLVDRGTPGAMLTDVTKFLNWACGQEEIADQDQDLEKQLSTSDHAAEELQGGDKHSEITSADAARDTVQVAAQEATAPVAVAEAQHESHKSGEGDDQTQVQDRGQDGPEQGGILSSMTSTLQSGIDSYAPQSVANYMHRQTNSDNIVADDMSDSSDSSSTDSFLSADEMKRLSTAPEHQDSQENMSIRSGVSSSEAKIDKKNMTQPEKDLLKISQQREKLDQKRAKKREAEENKFKQSQGKDQSEQDKARDKMEKELKKTEERHRKEIEKLEGKKDREERKAEEKRKKKDDQNKLSMVARERDDLRSQASLLRRENALLADQVESLQKENTALAHRIGKLAGPDALKSVQDEVKKAGSIKASNSHTSLQSAAETKITET